jgi:hypothetical protein
MFMNSSFIFRIETESNLTEPNRAELMYSLIMNINTKKIKNRNNQKKKQTPCSLG